MPITAEETQKRLDLDKSPISDLKAQFNDIERHSEELITQGRPIAGNSMASEALHYAILDREHGHAVRDTAQSIYATPQAQAAIQVATQQQYVESLSPAQHGEVVEESEVGSEKAEQAFEQGHFNRTIFLEAAYSREIAELEAWHDPETKRWAMTYVAKEATQDIDEGHHPAISWAGPKSNLPEYDAGQRQAIVDWSRETNQALLAEPQYVQWINPERIGASQQTIHESFESSVTQLEHFAEGLSRHPDVSKELKETWAGFQQDTPTAPRSKTLGEATEALVEAYIHERTHEQEITPQRVSAAREIGVSV